jgi:hypothetical protein
MEQTQTGPPPVPHVSIRAFAKKTTAAILILAAGFVGGWLLAAFVYPGHGISPTLTQSGERPIVFGPMGWENAEVFYPRPYRSKPDLTITPGVTLLEQRPDGFKVFIKKEVTSTLTWTARGMPEP